MNTTESCSWLEFDKANLVESEYIVAYSNTVPDTADRMSYGAAFRRI